jgi:hypothetical protein
MPGNPCLAVFIAGTSSTFHGAQLNISQGLNYAILVGAIVVYVALNLLDLASNYTLGQMLSKTKVYHNLLYLWYGYLAVACFAGMVNADVSLGLKCLVTIPGLLWLACLVSDNFASKEVQEQRFKYAHVESVPIWKLGWRLRRRTATGYALVP